jgi:DNA-directed RNA polymerase subunit RPC12/RpoP
LQVVKLRLLKGGGITMNSCMRCGTKLQHNYLVTVFKVTKDKRERMIVCVKCREIINKAEIKA